MLIKYFIMVNFFRKIFFKCNLHYEILIILYVNIFYSILFNLNKSDLNSVNYFFLYFFFFLPFKSRVRLLEHESAHIRK
jgi:hypothetical protein